MLASWIPLKGETSQSRSGRFGRPTTRPPVSIICEFCGESFEDYESKNRRFHNRSCASKAKAKARAESK